MATKEIAPDFAPFFGMNHTHTHTFNYNNTTQSLSPDLPPTTSLQLSACISNKPGRGPRANLAACPQHTWRLDRPPLRVIVPSSRKCLVGSPRRGAMP
ncbi:MAG: hypothetical protein Q9192_004651 [Flavoplaca navasiana]